LLSVQGTLTTIWSLEFNWTAYVLSAVALTALAATDCAVSLPSLTIQAVDEVAVE
jgi:hypothetical protein